MSSYLYKGIYVTLLASLVVGSVLSLFTGAPSDGRQNYMLYAENTGSFLPNLVIARRDARIEEGGLAVYSKNGMYAETLLVESIVRDQGGLVYLSQTVATPASSALYRQVAAVPGLGLMVVVAASLWGQLLLIAVPLLMLATHAVLSLLLVTPATVQKPVRTQRTSYTARNAQGGSRYARTGEPHYFDEEVDGITELDTLVLDRRRLGRYPVFQNGTMRLGI